jgi:hypothetical protein
MHEEGAVAADRHARPVRRRSFAPSAPATPKPIGPKPIEPISESGRRGLQNWMSQL